MFENLPLEMREFRQWIVWRFEDCEGSKPTKVPYSPITHRPVSVRDANSWASYDEAVNVARSNNTYAGIGFVLTEADPYAFIDLDDTGGDRIEFDRQMKIYNQFDSYAELSPSGNGLHIIIRGAIPSGRRRSKIEIYSNLRFMTMTGNVHRGGPIGNYHDLLNVLYEQMGGDRDNSAAYMGNEPETQSDEELVGAASTAANGEKFYDLYSGNWHKHYASQSEADMALVDIIAYYTFNRQQVARVFRESALGQRAKAQRVDYVDYMLNKCFDNRLPPIDFDGLRNQLDEVLAQRSRMNPDPTPQSEIIDADETAGVIDEAPVVTLENKRSVYSPPPGLMGEIAQFIYSAAPRPVPEIALAGAMGLMAGIVGRAYNVSGTGLNSYTMLLAGTGCHAKGASILMHDGSVKLVENVLVGELIMGPDSQPRLVQALARGRQQMARITPVKGESFVVNMGHIMPLIHTSKKEVTNVTVSEWLTRNDKFKHCHKIQRTGVEFGKQGSLRIPAWFMGALLGDGAFVGSPSLTGMDEAIHDAALKAAGWFGVGVNRQQPENNKAWQIRYTTVRGQKNPLADELRTLGLWGCKADSKFIPQRYKTASRANRLAILAGLIDTDGSLSCNGYDFISKSKTLADDVAFVSRSLGFAAYVKQCEKRSQNGTNGVYHRVSISGDLTELPLVLEYKKATPRLQKKSVLVTGFSVEALPEDDFYGFSLDGDHLYLTDDFTIHHNTGKEAIARGISRLIKEVGAAVPTANEFIGPGEIASPQAITKFMAKGRTSFVSVLGEFGLYLRTMSGPYANPNMLGIKRFLLDVFNKSGNGDSMQPSIYADSDKNTSVLHSPNLCIIGESTPERFYESIDEEMISEGLIPRFTIIEYIGKRPPLNRNHEGIMPSFNLVTNLASLCGQAMLMNSQNKHINVLQNREATVRFDDFNTYCDDRINDDGSRDYSKQLWNRAHIKALKLAATVAVGCNPYDPVIDLPTAEWAIGIICADARGIESRFNAGRIGANSQETEQLEAVTKALKQYVTSPMETVEKYVGGLKNVAHLHKMGIVPFSYVSRRIGASAAFRKDARGATDAIRRTLRIMIDRGDIIEIPKGELIKNHGAGYLAFAVANAKGLGL